MAIVTVNLGCQSDQIESHLENWFSTLLGAPVRVFQGWLAWTSTNWGWKTYPKCGQHSSIGRDPDGTKTRKKSACVQAWFFLRWCGVAASFTDSSFFSLWRWTHTSNSPGSFQTFSLRLGLHHWSPFFWGFQLFGMNICLATLQTTAIGLPSLQSCKPS